jgi:hypothetical protein
MTVMAVVSMAVPEAMVVMAESITPISRIIAVIWIRIIIVRAIDAISSPAAT